MAPDTTTTPDTTTEPDTPVTPDAQEPDVPVGPEPDATTDAGDAATDTGEDTGPPPECETEAECQHLAAPCVLGICVDGACTTSPDTCDDGDTCTEDSCDLEAGCQNVYGALTCEGAAVAYTTTVDDAANVLGGVTVEGTGDVLSSDLNTGQVTLTNTAGSYVWTFSAEGYLPVWRSTTLAQGQVLTVPTPWLHPRNPNSHVAVPGEEATATSQDLSVSVTVGIESVAEETTATVTALDGQTLPAELPRGWSPVQGFWLEMSAEPAEALQVTANPWFEVSGDVVLVTLDAEGGYWVISTTLEVPEGDALDFEVWGAGAYAVVVADADPQGPDAGLEGEILTGVEATDPETDGFSAEGSLLPVISAVSSDPEAVTARALIELSHETAGAMSSGYPLHGTTTQTYWLQDGSTVALPTSPYELVSYQRPDDDDPTTLHAEFSVRPGLLFDHSELLEASNVLSIWSGEAPTVDVLDVKGGSASSEAVSVTVPEGALA
ncbi:MAG: hypothetical protein VX747_04015, partial [Actinomycetota bacterium]|nr:hypothetical protein [Actinomycetota bacterium]